MLLKKAKRVKLKDKKKPKPKKKPISIKGLDIDKNEYQEIVLSNSNKPDFGCGKRDY